MQIGSTLLLTRFLCSLGLSASGGERRVPRALLAGNREAPDLHTMREVAWRIGAKNGREIR